MFSHPLAFFKIFPLSLIFWTFDVICLGVFCFYHVMFSKLPQSSLVSESFQSLLSQLFLSLFVFSSFCFFNFTSFTPFDIVSQFLDVLFQLFYFLPSPTLWFPKEKIEKLCTLHLCVWPYMFQTLILHYSPFCLWKFITFTSEVSSLTTSGVQQYLLQVSRSQGSTSLSVWIWGSQFALQLQFFDGSKKHTDFQFVQLFFFLIVRTEWQSPTFLHIRTDWVLSIFYSNLWLFGNTVCFSLFERSHFGHVNVYNICSV